jgi:uncharacterized membrane protein
MKTIFSIFVIGFCFVGLCLLLVSIVYIINVFSNVKQHKKNVETIIEDNLAILNSDTTPEDKADAVEQLIKCQYIKVHTLQNKGNNYDDQRLTDMYHMSMTRNTLSTLLNLEATDGGFTF